METYKVFTVRAVVEFEYDSRDGLASTEEEALADAQQYMSSGEAHGSDFNYEVTSKTLEDDE